MTDAKFDIDLFLLRNILCALSVFKVNILFNIVYVFLIFYKTTSRIPSAKLRNDKSNYFTMKYSN